MPSSMRFTLIDRHGPLVDAWKESFARVLDSDVLQRFRFLQTALADVKAPWCDCIVSPANSYGIMDGGFDYYLSKVVAPGMDIMEPTRVVQKQLYARYRGYMSPGQCALVALPEDMRQANATTVDCRYIAVCPTMRVPEDVRWNMEVVYESMWNLLAELDNHNKGAEQSSEAGEVIKTVLMTGFGTGTGLISMSKCAEQMALAIKHFELANQHPEEWSHLDWQKVRDVGKEIESTRDL